jgi:SulP family sulfate permease
MTHALGLLPHASDYAGLRSSWRRDVAAGVTVAIVALPLALAFGITSGIGAAAGLATAIVAGLVAAVFGGSHVQVSGPTGAMTVVLVPIVHRYGPSAVQTVAVLAGILLVVAAVAGIGRYLAFVPWPVVEGFTVGIAVIILLQQVPAALGVATPEGDQAAVVAIRAVVDAGADGRPAAMATTALVALVMVVLPRLHRSLPASLLAVGLATVVARTLGLDVARIGDLPAGLPAPSLPAMGAMGDLFGAALAVALLAGLESLLSAKVADGMSDAPGHDPDRELLGQGLANVASPFFGGMPATGAIARTAVNVRAGARTRVAAVTHALVLVAVVYLGGPVVAEIPIAALAGVLVVTAVRMIEVGNVRAVLGSTRSDAVVLVATGAATIAFDLVVAVEVGIAIAALLALRKVALSAEAVAERIAADPVAGREDEVSPDDEAALASDHIVAYRLDGALFFGASQRFLVELTSVADVRVVILRLADLQVLDATGARAIGAIVAELEGRGTTVLLKGPSDRHRKVLEAVGALDALASPHHVFDDLGAAVAHARLHVARIAHAAFPDASPQAGAALPTA